MSQTPPAKTTRQDIVSDGPCGEARICPLLVQITGPGIGIELAEDAADLHPYRPREVKTRLHVDGSVVDQ